MLAVIFRLVTRILHRMANDASVRQAAEPRCLRLEPRTVIDDLAPAWNRDRVAEGVDSGQRTVT